MHGPSSEQPSSLSSSGLIDSLCLEPHPEGGYYREIYRSRIKVPKPQLSDDFSGDRYLSTHIYFLLHGSDISKFHRLKGDELWHHYLGAGLTIHLIDNDGTHVIRRLGKNTAAEQQPCVEIPAGTWFAAECDNPDGYALVGCSVFPGFEFDDFELARRDALYNLYPQHASLIARFSSDS